MPLIRGMRRGHLGFRTLCTQRSKGSGTFLGGCLVLDLELAFWAGGSGSGEGGRRGGGEGGERWGPEP